MDIDDYIAAATAENTRRSYQAGVRHFEREWGGFLPASAENVARYLAHYAGSLSTNTLRSRLASLAQWHLAQGFPDPTKAPIVRKTLKGIAISHPSPPRQAKPLQLQLLEFMAGRLEAQAGQAESNGDFPAQLRALRDRAILLVGFWRAFRSDELSHLRIEHTQVVAGQGIVFYLSSTKTSRDGVGVYYRSPALSRLCPVAAYLSWIGASKLSEGPIFRGIDRWGHISNTALNAGSFLLILRNLLTDANISAADQYSSHSLRRGFATWATINGWDMKSLMGYVGWKDASSAMRYIEGEDQFSQQRIESILANIPVLMKAIAPEKA